jgi:hypothetical protein
MGCEGRCKGCALKIGAMANEEVTNRLTAFFSALGGTPFVCHENFGWTGDRTNYPDGAQINRVMSNLMTAPTLIHDLPNVGQAISDATATGVPPSIFDGDRAVLGRQPYCQGWQAAVARLQNLGWFQDKTRRTVRRTIAAQGIRAIERLGRTKNKADRRKDIAEIGAVMGRLTEEMKRDGCRVTFRILESD